MAINYWNMLWRKTYTFIYVDGTYNRWANILYVISVKLHWSQLTPKIPEYSLVLEECLLIGSWPWPDHVTRFVMASELRGQALVKVIHLSSHHILRYGPTPADSTFRNPLTCARHRTWICTLRIHCSTSRFNFTPSYFFLTSNPSLLSMYLFFAIPFPPSFFYRSLESWLLPTKTKLG